MKLTIENLAPYLPYKLLGLSPSGSKFYLSVGSNMLGRGIENRGIETFVNGEYKIILRPLSDLMKEICHNGEKFMPIDYLWFEVISIDRDAFNKDDFYENCELGAIDFLPIMVYKKLHEWHFDTMGFIGAGLGIDINELEKHASN